MISFYEQAVPHLKIAELYSERMKNNKSIIEGMELYYKEKNENGTIRRVQTIEWIEALRGGIYRIIHKIFQKINTIYDQKIYGENSDIISLIEIINEEYSEINNNGTKLVEYIKNFFKYDENYTFYLDDVKSIITIYYNTSIIRENAYREYFINSLKKNDEDYITSLINSFKNEFQNYVDQIIEKIKILHYSEALELCQEMIDNIPIILNNYLNITLSNKIKDKYLNITLLEEMSEKYYEEVTPAFMEFNNTFFEKTYKSHLKYYISVPTEVINLLRIIKNMEDLKLNKIIEDINTLIISYINNEIKDAYQRASISLDNYLDYLHAQAPKKQYGISGNNRKLYEDIENYFINARNSLLQISNSSPLLYVRKKKDEFNITQFFQDKEFEIINNILGKIINEIDNNFQNYFCKEMKCENGTIIQLSYKDQYHFHAAKIRDSISYLKTLISMAKEILNKNILSNLSSYEFLNLYKIDFYYNSNTLVSQIFEFLKK